MHELDAGDISVMVRYGDLQVALQAEGVSWSPDVAADMVTRVQSLWSGVLAEAKVMGMLHSEEAESKMKEVGDVG